MGEGVLIMDDLQVACIACTANAVAYSLRADYMSEAHRAAVDLATKVSDRHSGCSLDRDGSLADRILVRFQ